MYCKCMRQISLRVRPSVTELRYNINTACNNYNNAPVTTLSSLRSTCVPQKVTYPSSSQYIYVFETTSNSYVKKASVTWDIPNLASLQHSFQFDEIFYWPIWVHYWLSRPVHTMTSVRKTAAVQFVHKALKQLTMEEGISPWEKEKEGERKKKK